MRFLHCRLCEALYLLHAQSHEVHDAGPVSVRKQTRRGTCGLYSTLCALVSSQRSRLIPKLNQNPKLFTPVSCPPRCVRW